MRGPIGALRIAAEAEGLRLRAHAARTATRIVLGVVALVFLLVTLAFAHIAVWYWVRLTYGWTQYATAGAVAGGDLLFTLVLGVLAARSSPSRIEREALDVRRKALEGASTTLAASTLVVPVARVLVDMMHRRR